MTIYNTKGEVTKRADVEQMTLQELQTAVEKDGKLLFGCKGKIYDVTTNENYMKKYTYMKFVGKDASVALAKMNFDNGQLMDTEKFHWSRNLDQQEMKILEDWCHNFDNKYMVVGHIKNDGGS